MEAGLLRTEGRKEARFSGVAAAYRVRLGMRTGVVAASGPEALTRTDGAKSDKREDMRCPGRERRAIAPHPRGL